MNKPLLSFLIMPVIAGIFSFPVFAWTPYPPEGWGDNWAYEPYASTNNGDILTVEVTASSEYETEFDFTDTFDGSNGYAGIAFLPDGYVYLYPDAINLGAYVDGNETMGQLEFDRINNRYRGRTGHWDGDLEQYLYEDWSIWVETPFSNPIEWVLYYDTGGIGYNLSLFHIQGYNPILLYENNPVSSAGDGAILGASTNAVNTMATVVPVGFGVLITSTLLFKGLAWFKGIAGMRS